MKKMSVFAVLLAMMFALGASAQSTNDLTLKVSESVAGEDGRTFTSQIRPNDPDARIQYTVGDTETQQLSVAMVSALRQRSNLNPAAVGDAPAGALTSPGVLRVDPSTNNGQPTFIAAKVAAGTSFACAVRSLKNPSVGGGFDFRTVTITKDYDGTATGGLLTFVVPMLYRVDGQYPFCLVTNPDRKRVIINVDVLRTTATAPLVSAVLSCRLKDGRKEGLCIFGSYIHNGPTGVVQSRVFVGNWELPVAELVNDQYTDSRTGETVVVLDVGRYIALKRIWAIAPVSVTQGGASDGGDPPTVTTQTVSWFYKNPAIQ